MSPLVGDVRSATGVLNERQQEDAKRMGGHLHFGVDDRVNCLNGHVWRVIGDVVMERAA